MRWSMSSNSAHIPYNPEVAGRILDLIAAKRDSIVFQELSLAPSSVRAEAAREFLYRKDKAGYDAARQIVEGRTLSEAELRSVFVTAAECGETRMLTFLARFDPTSVDGKTIRDALVGAMYSSTLQSIQWVADTPLISTEAKYQAITPSIYRSNVASRASKKVREEMGTAETIITKSYREARVERRERQRSERMAIKPLSPEEKRRIKIERRFNKLLESAVFKIKIERQRQISALKGPELVDHREITELLIKQVTREVARQRELALSRRITTAGPGKKTPDRAEQVASWRGTNPAGHEDSPSFAELLESFFLKARTAQGEAKLTFSEFVDVVLATWGTNGHPMSREALCQLIQEKHPLGFTLTNNAFYQWKNHPNQSPNTESIKKIAAAFKLDPLHELLVFRVAKGTPCPNLEALVMNAEDATRTPHEAAGRGELFTALRDAAGIPLVDLSAMLNVQQISLWRKGQRIEDPMMASRAVDLLNPVDIYPSEEHNQMSSLNLRIKAVLSGRVASVLDAVLLAERSKVENPGGLLFSLLLGQRGMFRLSHRAAASMLQVTEGKIKRIGGPSSMPGGEITEHMASLVMDYVQGVSLQTRHLLSPLERMERELAVDTLTGVPSPVRLLMKVKLGELPHVGEVYRLTRHRRGVMQPHGMSDFEMGKAALNHGRAVAAANWLGFKGPQHREARRLFITLATGSFTKQSPAEIVDDMLAGRISRVVGLRKLCDWTGLTRAELALRIGAPESSGKSYLTTQLDGRIFNRNRITALAEELGLRHRIDDLVRLFTPKRFTPSVSTLQSDSA